MTTVAILPVSDANGERLYRAIAGLEMNSQAQVTARQLWIRLGLFPQGYLYRPQR